MCRKGFLQGLQTHISAEVQFSFHFGIFIQKGDFDLKHISIYVHLIKWKGIFQFFIPIQAPEFLRGQSSSVIAIGVEIVEAHWFIQILKCLFFFFGAFEVELSSLTYANWAHFVNVYNIFYFMYKKINLI